MIFLWAVGTSSGRADVEDGPEPAPRPQNPPADTVGLHLRKRQWTEATAILRPLVQRSPGDWTARLQLARSLAMLRRREDAIAVLEGDPPAAFRARVSERRRWIAMTYFTNVGYQLAQEAWALMQEGRDRPGPMREAAERWERALGQEPGHARVLMRLGQVALLRGETQRAVERLRAALRMHPQDPEARLWFGRALHQKGEILVALEELAQARAAGDRSELGALWWAEALWAAGRQKAAIEFLELERDRAPLNLEPQLALARYRLAGGRATALVRHDLQLALSRADRLEGAAEPAEPETVVSIGERGRDGEARFEPLPARGTIRVEIERLFAQIVEPEAKR